MVVVVASNARGDVIFGQLPVFPPLNLSERSYFAAKTNANFPDNTRRFGLPTIQVYKDGELVKSFKGAKSKSTLLGAIEEYL